MKQVFEDESRVMRIYPPKPLFIPFSILSTLFKVICQLHLQSLKNNEHPLDIPCQSSSQVFPRLLKNTMTTFPYQYATMPSTYTVLPGIDEPLTTSQTTTQTSEPNPTTDISSNVSNLVESVKNFDSTTLMMIGGSFLILQ